MKKAKVILIILIMLILVVSIVSCQKQNSQKGNDTRSDQDQADVGDCSQTESGSKQELADESPSPGDSMETKHVNTQLQKITFALDWTPNTNHSGLFLAQQQGYYAEEGLDVDFQESDMNFIEMVATGSAPFGIASQEQVYRPDLQRQKYRL